MALSLDKKHKREREIQLECDTQIKGQCQINLLNIGNILLNCKGSEGLHDIVWFNQFILRAIRGSFITDQWC